MTAVFLSWWRAFVMLQHPEASPWCSEKCSLSVLCRITHNCLTPSQHGHSVGLGLTSFTYHTPPTIEVCMCATFFPPFLLDAHFSVHFRVYGRIWALLARFIRGYASLFHIFFPLASAFDITPLSSWHLRCLPLAGKLKKERKKRLSSPPACSPHSRLYWFP